jgi:hypothetical protein
MKMRFLRSRNLQTNNEAFARERQSAQTMTASQKHKGYDSPKDTVDSLITHTPMWTAQAMGFEGLLVMRERFWCKFGGW